MQLCFDCTQSGCTSADAKMFGHCFHCMLQREFATVHAALQAQDNPVAQFTGAESPGNASSVSALNILSIQNGFEVGCKQLTSSLMKAAM